MLMATLQNPFDEFFTCSRCHPLFIVPGYISVFRSIFLSVEYDGSVKLAPGKGRVGKNHSIKLIKALLHNPDVYEVHLDRGQAKGILVLEPHEVMKASHLKLVSSQTKFR